MGQGESPRRFNPARCQYPSLEKFKDTCNAALYLIQTANKAVGCGTYGRFSNLHKFRPEAAGDIISGMFVGQIVLDKCVVCKEMNNQMEQTIENNLHDFTHIFIPNGAQTLDPFGVRWGSSPFLHPPQRGGPL